MKVDKNKVKSILFITLSNLGDIILTTPVLEKLLDEFPGADIDIVTGPAGQEIFTAHPRIRDVIVYKKHKPVIEMIQDLLDLRRKRYELVVDLKNSLIPYIVGARFRTSVFNFSGGKRHKREEHLSKLLSLGIDAFRDNRFFLPASDQDRHFVDQVLSSGAGKKIVAINPGAKSHLKRWDAVRFAGLSDRLVSELGCKVFICGNDDDREVVQRVLSSVARSAEDLCCKTSIGALSELMKRADLVITNDSAPLHMASAVNAPTVAIFGPSDERKYGPLADRSKVVVPDVSCRPCGKALCAIGPDEGCISSIEVDEVFEAAKELLELKG